MIKRVLSFVVFEYLEGIIMSFAKFTRCQTCANYQQYEPNAGLLECCVVPRLYIDDNCQVINLTVRKEINHYWRKCGEGCPYFKDAAQ